MDHTGADISRGNEDDSGKAEEESSANSVLYTAENTAYFHSHSSDYDLLTGSDEVVTCEDSVHECKTSDNDSYNGTNDEISHPLTTSSRSRDLDIQGAITIDSERNTTGNSDDNKGESSADFKTENEIFGNFHETDELRKISKNKSKIYKTSNEVKGQRSDGELEESKSEHESALCAEDIGEQISEIQAHEEAVFHENIERQRKSYGSPVKGNRFRKYGTYSVRIRSDIKRNVITGVCQLEDKRLVLSDSENFALKTLDPVDFNVLSSTIYHSNPSLMCFVSGNKVAIAFANNDIAFVNFSEDVKYTRWFSTKYACKGLAYSKRSIYLCSSNQIEIYNESGDGEQCNTITFEVNGRQSNCLTNILIYDIGEIMLVSDKENGIIIADKEGHVLTVISEGVHEPNALCADDFGNIYATEMHSERIVNIDLVTVNVTTVLRDVNGKDHPICMGYESTNNRLIVGVWSSDNVHVFERV